MCQNSNNHISKLLIIPLFSIISSCQEPYYFDEEYPTEEIPVFDGEITDSPGPYKVVLKYAKPFFETKNKSPQIIINALVTISDDKGNSEILSFTSAGEYCTSKNGIRGVVGRKYKLEVKLSNGLYYESVQTTLEPSELIDSLYAEPGTCDYAVIDGTGEMTKKTTQGIYVYIDIKSTANSTRYYLFNNIVMNQKIFSDGKSGTSYIRSISYPDNFFNIKSSVFYNQIQIVQKHKLFFLPYNTEMILNSDSVLVPIIPAGWLVKTSLFTISSESYSYYIAADVQLRAGSQLFDPIPTQIKGNIKCKTDTNKMALGLFRVYSKSSKMRAFGWMPNNKIVKTINIKEYGPLQNDTSNMMPPYWIYF
jgi:hypothetical protein